jgi:regulator of replication initiation timing
MAEPFTTLGLAKTTSDIIKEALDFARNAKNTDLAEKMIDLYRDFIELVDTNQQLRRENQNLQDTISDLQKHAKTTAEMRFRAPLYFQQGDATPFCPKCFEKDGRAIHLIEYGGVNTDKGPKTRWNCSVCNQDIYAPTALTFGS